MEVRFEDEALAAVEPDGATTTAGRGKAVDKKFRQRMKVIRDAPDERDFYALRFLHFEKLKGNREHQHSMKLDDQWRLILEFEGEAPHKTVVIVGIEDYH